MQLSTQVMVAHVDPTPETATRCPPYAHMPSLGHCSTPLHLIGSPGFQHRACGIIITWREMHFRPPSGFPPPLLDDKRGSQFLHWCSMHIMGLLSRHGQAKRRREHFVPMHMTVEWFKAAKAHIDSPSLGRSVHHVKGIEFSPPWIHKFTVNAPHPRIGCSKC